MEYELVLGASRLWRAVTPVGRRTANFGGRLLPLVVELRTKVLVVVRQLAARSALRKKQVFAWSAALPHCLPSLGRSTVFFLLAFFFGSWAVLAPWAEAHGSGSEQTGGLKPLFAIKMEKLASRKTTTVQPQPQRKIPSNEGMTIFSIA
ncbi:hypothetical protein SGRA_3514 [Saprospira grandis str. Lewin]|uniref:Uncharacterized protein n=1 Tax=Saprospira grandis (strain Lewin) TaxID=984262 RepID=H6L074_SAPGL|nr:hypothetical protein SGRA_3514 [Saprospira grandis str. Lewin]